jgi:hypothetical protein
LLERDLIFDESAIKLDVEIKYRIIYKEIENYLNSYDNFSLSNLNSNDFNSLLFSPIGNKGYILLIQDSTNLNIVRSVNFNMSNISLDYIKADFPDLFNLLNKSVQKGSSEGFYSWKELDGRVATKYGKFAQLKVNGSEEVNIIGFTAYVSDYKVFNLSSTGNDYFTNFSKKKDYNNILLISKEGYISYMLNKEEDFGTNLNWTVNLGKGISKNYFEVKENQEISFYGPFISNYGDLSPRLSIVTPVYENGELLGYLGLIDDFESVFKIVENNSHFEETYLVKEDNLLISPLKNHNLDILIQTVNTTNVEECIQDLQDIQSKGVKKNRSVDEFLNYEGNMVFGRNYPISKTNWCLVSEANKEDILDKPLKIFYIRRLIVFLGIILFSSLIGFFTGRYFDKRYAGGKNKKR